MAGSERRAFVGVRLAPSELDAVRATAEAEHGGNLSQAIRALLGEAIEARQRKSRW